MSTASCAEALRPPAAIVMVVLPTPAAFTSPDVSTFATAVSDDLYVTVTPVTEAPAELVALNVICAWSPTRRVSWAGESVRDASRWLAEQAEPNPHGAVGPVPFSAHAPSSVTRPIKQTRIR